MLDRRQFLVRAGAAGLALGGIGRAWPDQASAAASPVNLLRGVTYDTGTLTLGETTRRVWSTARMEDEIGVIADRLRCSTVSVFGSDPHRLEASARAALGRGLRVAIQPRLYDHSQREVLAHLAEVGERAEALRREHPDAVTLIAGCEHMLFTAGIVPGRTFEDRIAALGSGKVDFEAAQRRLYSFLGRAAATARRHFAGTLTYAAAEFEAVDWSRFDLVGLDYYAFHKSAAGHRRTLRPYRRWGKPIAILEFGCCTYRGAPRRGGSGYDIVDYAQQPPTLTGPPVRSEQTQANYIDHMFGIFEAEGLQSASVYTFIAPDLPYLPDPNHNLDTASFAVVETIKRRPFDPDSPTSGGRSGPSPRSPPATPGSPRPEHCSQNLDQIWVRSDAGAKAAIAAPKWKGRIMRLKKLGTALALLVALGAVAASAAFAAAEAIPATWRIGEAGTVLSGSESVTATGSGEIITTIGETPLKIKASGLECLECKIENIEGLAKGSGKVKLTGVTVTTPSTCAVSGGAVTTVLLDFTHYYMGGGRWFTLIEPFSGTTFATVTLTKGSGTCPIAGSYIVSGKLFTRANNATGVYAVSQTGTSSGAINTEGGGEFKFGSKSAELNGTATFSLSGTNKGKVFGAKE